MGEVCLGMKLNNWNSIRISCLALGHSLLCATLVRPWLQLAANKWHFTLSVALLWTITTLLICIAVVKRTSSQGEKDVPVLALGLLVPISFAFAFQLPLVLFTPLLLAFFAVAIRFNDYPKRARFAVDWALGSMLLIITSSLESTLALEVGIPSVLLFFSIGVASMILWNAAALEAGGLKPDYGGLGRSVLIFIFVVGAVSSALVMLLSPMFLQHVVDLAQRIYLVIVDGVILFVVRPFVWLLTPLFRWVENLELQDISLELPGNEMVEENVLHRPDSTLSPGAMDAITWVSWAVLVIVMAVILWIVIRRLAKRSRQDGGTLVHETRESVFSGSEVLDDLKAALRGLLRPLMQLAQPNWYRGDDPVLRIRSLYARFVVKARRKVPSRPDLTPMEYADNLVAAPEELDAMALFNLTELYNGARYGEVGDLEAVTRTEKALREVW